MICFSVLGRKPTRSEDQMVCTPPPANLKDTVLRVDEAAQPAPATRIVVQVPPTNDLHHEALAGSIHTV